MALRKGLGGCWAEGDSLSGMAVHYTMVTRSGLGHGDHCCSPVVTGGWWLGGAVVAGRWCGRVVSLPGCWRSLRVPVLLPVSPSHPVHVTPLSCHQAGSLLATLPPPSLYLCPGCHCVCILLQCSVWMLPGARCLANYRSMSQSYIPLRRPARPSPAWATDRPVSARGAAARPATSHQGGAGRGGAGVRPTTQLATAAQLSPTWSQPPPGSPGRYPAMIIQNARTKS